MGYPTSIFSPTTKNTGDTVQASHINDLQTEVVAIENALLNGSLTVPNQPRASVYSTALQTVSSSESTGTRLSFTTKLFDIGTGFSTAAGTYTAPSSGCYLFTVLATFVTGDPTGNLAFTVDGAFVWQHFVSTVGQSVSMSMLYNLNAGQAVALQFAGTSTTARIVGSTVTNFTTLSAIKMC